MTLFEPRAAYRFARSPEVIVKFSARSAAKDPATLDVVGADGATIRRLETPVRAGMNRLKWDLRHDSPRVVAAQVSSRRCRACCGRRARIRRRSRRRWRRARTPKTTSTSSSRTSCISICSGSTPRSARGAATSPAAPTSRPPKPSCDCSTYERALSTAETRCRRLLETDLPAFNRALEGGRSAPLVPAV